MTELLPTLEVPEFGRDDERKEVGRKPIPSDKAEEEFSLSVVLLRGAPVAPRGGDALAAAVPTGEMDSSPEASDVNGEKWENQGPKPGGDRRTRKNFTLQVCANAVRGTRTLEKIVVYLKCRLNWTACIFVC